MPSRFPGQGPRDLSKPLDRFEVLADERHDGLRLDQALALFLHWRSRTSIHRLIRGGFVELEGRRARKSSPIRMGDRIVVHVPPEAQPDDVYGDEFDIPILHEDRHLVVVDKPAGIAVHPAGRRIAGTLIHALHKRYRRPNDPAHDIVPKLLHRIDRETSGVLAIGLDERFHGAVRRQFEEREVKKVYQAVVHGRPDPGDGLIEFSIGPHRTSEVRLKVEARSDGSGLSARTHYRTLRSNGRFSLVELHPETGRTHQIRVHMEAIGCPLVGDKIYGVPDSVFLENLDGQLSDASRELLILDRHALHAQRLTFLHPFAEVEWSFEAPLPADMAALLDV